MLFAFGEDCVLEKYQDRQQKDGRPMNSTLFLFLSTIVAASMLCASAEAMETCTRSRTCDEAVQKCLAYRISRQLPPAELPCEASAARCRSTGIWSGKYTRGTPEVRSCRLP